MCQVATSQLLGIKKSTSKSLHICHCQCLLIPRPVATFYRRCCCAKEAELKTSGGSNCGDLGEDFWQYGQPLTLRSNAAAADKRRHKSSAGARSTCQNRHASVRLHRGKLGVRRSISLQRRLELGGTKNSRTGGVVLYLRSLSVQTQPGRQLLLLAERAAECCASAVAEGAAREGTEASRRVVWMCDELAARCDQRAGWVGLCVRTAGRSPLLC